MEIKDNNRVLAFWQNILSEGKIYSIAKKFRKDFDMPNSGFVFWDEFEAWRKKNSKNQNWEENRIKNCHDFIKNIKENILFAGIISDHAFSQILIEFYYFNNVHKDELLKKQYSEFNVVLMQNGKKICTSSPELDDGVYIKIGSYSPINHIKKYVENNASLIRDAQAYWSLGKENLPPKKLKVHKNWGRDKDILFFNLYTKEELKKHGVRGTYKEDMIAEIMKQCGYRGVMNGLVVKTVIQRMRKMTNALGQA